jgi:WD40 repeat protein
VLDPATVCSAKLPVQDAAILALSADQLLLACVSGGTVRVFSLPALLSHQSDAPAHTLQLGQQLLQFCWCPDASDSTQFLALTAGRVLLHGSLTSGTASLAEQVDCASWSPSGQHVAYCSSSSNKLVLTGMDWKDTAFKLDLPRIDTGRGESQ